MKFTGKVRAGYTSRGMVVFRQGAVDDRTINVVEMHNFS